MESTGDLSFSSWSVDEASGSHALPGRDRSCEDIEVDGGATVDEEPTVTAPPARRRNGGGGGRIEPAFISGTGSEFLGRKPLPRAARSRPLVFILGPKGVGKSAVAGRLLTDDHLHISDRQLLDAVTQEIRTGAWEPRLLQAPRVLFEGPCFLPLRPSFAHSVCALLRLRVEAGLRTIVTEAEDGSPLTDLFDVVAPERRATVLLRFPVGRGRRRYAVRVCEELGIDSRHARKVVDLEPWTYALVRATLMGIRDSGLHRRR